MTPEGRATLPFVAGSQVGRYRIEREVARGGMGAVFRARDPTGRAVALKLLLAGTAASPAQRRRLVVEVQALLRLRHPGVVELLDAGEHEGVPYLVMEWVEGETLAQRVAREGPLAPLTAAALARRLAQALEHCHAQGVLHRDLKPANVLVRGSDGTPLLTDFGLSKDVANESHSAVSRSGVWLGTPGYWSPEQARGELSRIGPRSDVYGLGALLYDLLTGLPPQQGETLQAQLDALDRPPTPPSRHRPGVPAWLDELCLRALAPRPEDRPASMAALTRGLSAGLERGSAPRPGRRWRRAWPVGAGLLVLGVTAGLVQTGLRWSRPPERAPAPPPGARSSSTGASTDEAAREQALSEAFGTGLARAQAGDHEAAIRAYDRAIALDPQHPQLYLSRALSWTRLDRFQRAIEDYDRAIELDPRSRLAWASRAAARVKLEQFAQAVADYDRALTIDPRYAQGYLDRGLARGNLGQARETIDDFECFLELAPDHELAPQVRGMLQGMRATLPGQGG